MSLYLGLDQQSRQVSEVLVSIHLAKQIHDWMGGMVLGPVSTSWEAQAINTGTLTIQGPT